MGRPARVSRDEVLKAARVEFGRSGYAGATLAAIGRRCGITAAAVLRHAPTKDALFAAAMMQTEKEDTIPMEMLAGIDPAADPRRVLRELAHRFIPFLDEKLDERIARWMHVRTVEDARSVARELRHPFGRTSLPTPPQRALQMLTAYFRRAARAGRMRVKDPPAAAMAFIGALHSYVFLNRIIHIVEPPIPLDQYLDTVLDVWTRGAIRPRRKYS